MPSKHLPPQECLSCARTHKGINGLHCDKLHRYVQQADTPPCRPQQNENNMDNKELAIIKPENIQAIVQAAPQSYNDNKNSHDRCIDFGLTILNAVRTQGMNDELDRQAASFIDKARRTVKVMNERRSPVTKLFDEVRSAFTTMENEIDPTKPGTVAYDLQQFRNQYAAKKRAEEEQRLREAEARRQAEEARQRFRQDVEDDFKRQFQQLVNENIDKLTATDNNVTLDTYEQSHAFIKGFDKELPSGWLANLKSCVRIPAGMDITEVKAVEADTKQRLGRQFSEQYAFEVGQTADYILDRLPSKKVNLEKMAKANAEEAARIKAEMEARQKAEAQRIEAERAAREAEERRKAEMERKTAEMTSLFDSQAVAATYAPKTKVTKKINLLNPEGIMPILSLWWSKEGCTLSVDELAKMFKKQIAFCEKLANKEDLTINDESVEYVDEVKAK